MKPVKGLNRSKLAFGFMLALSSSVVFAVPAPPMVIVPAKIYVGLFGGYASPDNVSVSQYGTALYTEAAGGPLAVNSFGTTTGNNVGVFGGKVGYQWAPVPFIPHNQEWGIAPAVELEGYTFGNNTFKGTTSNNTARLDEHTFNLSFPTRTNVYLANLVLNLEAARLGRFSPYVGAGVGGAFTRISGADATQLAPPEAGVNHFNSNASDSEGAVAGQVKVGLNVMLNNYFTMFVEYQWLYMASTSYVFGSTVYATHPVTSPWQVSMGAQQYNQGIIGLQLNI